MCAADLDEFVATLDYPMFVVTATDAGEPAGCLVGFATQTSIDPPRLLVCLSRANATSRVAARATHLAVHQLERDDGELARLFGEQSGDWTDKLARCDWHPGPHGAPVLERASAWTVGEVVGRFDLGDHDGVLLAPVAVGRRSSGRPLMFTDVDRLRPGHPA